MLNPPQPNYGPKLFAYWVCLENDTKKKSITVNLHRVFIQEKNSANVEKNF